MHQQAGENEKAERRLLCTEVSPEILAQKKIWSVPCSISVQNWNKSLEQLLEHTGHSLQFKSFQESTVARLLDCSSCLNVIVAAAALLNVDF